MKAYYVKKPAKHINNVRKVPKPQWIRAEATEQVPSMDVCAQYIGWIIGLSNATFLYNHYIVINPPTI